MSEELTSKGLQDVTMSTEEELAEIKEDPGEEAMVDYFGRCGEDADGDEDGDGDDDPIDDLDYVPGKRLRHRQTARRKGRGLKNMTYCHEQRIRMGYYGAKWGIKAMKRKFPGVKDSTARDMCNCVTTLVRAGILSLELPLEKQEIPPKTRNGMSISSWVKLTREKLASDKTSAEPELQEPVLNGAGEDWHPEIGVETRPSADACLEKADQIPASKSVTLDRKSPSTPPLSFPEKVKIGFVAATQGSSVAVKKFDASNTTVRECRNVVIRLIQAGKLHEGVPLEEQEIPIGDPDGTGGAARPAKRGRPPKHTFGRFTSPEPTALSSSSRMSIPKYGPPQTELSSSPTISDILEVSQPRNPLEVSLSPSTTPSPMHGPCPQMDHVQLHRGTKDIFLGSELAFLRWRNIRTSLGFQTDEAFAMHLMDVHDAFCSKSCRGGGRMEHQH